MRQRTIYQRLVTGGTAGATLVAVLLGVLLGASACGDSTSPEAQAEAVTTSYTNFTQAVAAKDGDRAASLLAAPSLTYFDQLRAAALDDDAKTLARRNVLDQITVLSLRDHLAVATLRSADATTLVSEAVKVSAISAGSSPQQPLGQVKVSGDAATAVLTTGAADSTQSQTIRFARESGTWKFDLTSLFGPAQEQLKSIQKSTGYSAAKLVQKVAEDRYGKAKAEQLLKPIGRT